MSHYVYPATNQPVPPEIAAEVTRVPPGISEKYPLGGFFTSDGVPVTKLKDAADGFQLAPTQDPTAFMKVDLIQSLKDQLNRIEAFLEDLATRA